MILWPGRSLGPAFAVAAVAGRLWTYHKNYDNVMLAFLLVPLAVFAIQRRAALVAVAGFLAMGLTLWIPARFAEGTVFQIGQVVVWLLGLVLFASFQVGWQRELTALWPSHRAGVAAGSRRNSSQTSAVAG